MAKVLITGTSKGIGYEATLLLARAWDTRSSPLCETRAPVTSRRSPPKKSSR